MSPCSCTIIPRSLKMSLISVMSAWINEHKEKWLIYAFDFTVNTKTQRWWDTLYITGHADVDIWFFFCTSNCLMDDSLSWISLRSSSVMASSWACNWESLQENKCRCNNNDDDNIYDTKKRKNDNWQKYKIYLGKGETFPKLSSGWPPC